MLHNKYFESIIFALLFSLGSSMSVFGWTKYEDDTYTSSWGITNDSYDESFGAPEQFVQKGAIGSNNISGTYGNDEGAIVGVIATTINANGALFCPVQIQVGNQNWYPDRIWMRAKQPVGYTSDKCAWLCKNGKTGQNCAYDISSSSICDSSNIKDAISSGIAVRTSGDGGYSMSSAGEFSIKEDDDNGKAYVVVLGVVNFLEHGAVVAPVKVSGATNQGWPQVHSYVSNAILVGNKTVVCAAGYKPNSTNTDCVMVDPTTCAQTTEQKLASLCPGWQRVGFDETRHKLVPRANCFIYTCAQAGYAFDTATNHNCTECGSNAKVGISSVDGTCIKCETGQYFDEQNNKCAQSKAYSKTQMQYGINGDKNTPVSQQCWTIANPTDYVECVMGNTPKTGGSDAVVTSGLSKANINDVIKNKALGEWRQTHQSAAAPDIH